MQQWSGLSEEATSAAQYGAIMSKIITSRLGKLTPALYPIISIEPPVPPRRFPSAQRCGSELD